MPDCISVKQLREEILELVKENGLVGEKNHAELPNSWEKYGDLVLFQSHCFSSSIWTSLGDKLWELICSLLKCKRVGLKGCINNDDFRTPKMALVYGQPGDVYFTDNGIKFSWDLERNMFCRGNLSERHRIAKLNCKHEVIVDLFAGIGYYTLPYLVKTNAKFVHACEWNPCAIKALRRNLKMNKVSEKCTIYEGDNRKFAPKNIGNRINVGIIPDSEEFWSTACEALLSTGGIIYIHQNITSGIMEHKEDFTCQSCLSLVYESKLLNNKCCISVRRTTPCLQNVLDININWKQIEWFKYSLHISHSLINHLENFHKGMWEVTVKEYFKVKSYAPHIDHLVYGVYCSPL